MATERADRPSASAALSTPASGREQMEQRRGIYGIPLRGTAAWHVTA
ncbi:MAG: hypothetical protein IT189_11100 [Microbacteriaceae bacterium]|nr:hypothetical protein [Microbacteriaceae bacterium]